MKPAYAPAHTHARVCQENRKQVWQLEGTKGSAPLVTEADEVMPSDSARKKNQNFL